MFRFFTVVSAVYLYHKQTKRFLGFEKRPHVSLPAVVPVKDTANAVDFKISTGGVLPSDKEDSTTTEIVKGPGAHILRIMDPKKKLSFETDSNAIKDGNRLIMCKNNTSRSQHVGIYLLSNFSYGLVWMGKCYNYDAEEDLFKTGSCNNVKAIELEIYSEIMPGKKIITRDFHNLENSNSSDNAGKDDLIYNDDKNIKLLSNGKKGKKLDFKKLNPEKLPQHDKDIVSAYKDISTDESYKKKKNNKKQDSNSEDSGKNDQKSDSEDSNNSNESESDMKDSRSDKRSSKSSMKKPKPSKPIKLKPSSKPKLETKNGKFI